MMPVEIYQGNLPILLGFPHTGTWLPEKIYARLNEQGRRLADTDWHVDRLYKDILPKASRICAVFHRYVIDPNRDPADINLYPGRNSTGLVPECDFDGASIWKTPPCAEDKKQRLCLYHAAYHTALANELERLHQQHGIVLFYDCHSIRSELPFLFDGRLPDLNIGTNDSTSCSKHLEDILWKNCSGTDLYTSIRNGRFKGGWCTRHYGRPQQGVHAIQMELAQSTYLKEEAPPWIYDQAKAKQLRNVLGNALESLAEATLAAGTKNDRL